MARLFIYDNENLPQIGQKKFVAPLLCWTMTKLALRSFSLPENSHYFMRRNITLPIADSVTRSGNLLDFGQLLNAFGNT